MKRCPNCGEETEARVCPNCGQSLGGALSPIPWFELVLLIVVGMPCLMMGACGIIFLAGSPQTFTISVPSMIVGLGGYYVTQRLYREAQERRRVNVVRESREERDGE